MSSIIAQEKKKRYRLFASPLIKWFYCVHHLFSQNLLGKNDNIGIFILVCMFKKVAIC